MGDLNTYKSLVRSYAKEQCHKMFREPGGHLHHKFIVPGSAYTRELWDWDSWLTDLALARICTEDISDYEQGCVLNYLENIHENGWMPITITTDLFMPPFGNDPVTENLNTHKPCLAQHALFISDRCGNVDWLAGHFEAMERYLSFYFQNNYHEKTGLYLFLDDTAIGIDNDPSVFNRPEKSTASIYLNCLMYKELCAASALAGRLNKAESQALYAAKAEALKNAIQEHCWDERDGFFYSVDVNLTEAAEGQFLHSGAPRHWPCLLLRIDCWGGFLPLWAGIATKEQAERVLLRWRDDRTFHAAYGVRSLSKLEKMYAVKVSGNPSCWLGPIWIIANYMLFEGCLNYGYTADAKELAEKTVTLLGQDIEQCGDLHEYYDPDSGKGVNNIGFQSWNLLAYNMADWLDENI